MKTVVFNSPHQQQVLAGEFNLLFERGVPKDVDDEIADTLLKYNFNFSEHNPQHHDVTAHVESPTVASFSQSQPEEPTQPVSE